MILKRDKLQEFKFDKFQLLRQGNSIDKKDIDMIDIQIHTHSYLIKEGYDVSIFDDIKINNSTHIEVSVIVKNKVNIVTFSFMEISTMPKGESIAYYINMDYMLMFLHSYFKCASSDLSLQQALETYLGKEVTIRTEQQTKMVVS